MNRNILWIALCAFAIPLFSGCSSGLNPVKGTVAYEDGTHLTAGTVVVETADAAGDAKRFSANGNIQSDGSFLLTSTNPGDGVPTGRYRVAVLSPALSDEQRGKGEKPLVDEKFSQLDTSGLQIEVKPGRNEITLTVAKPGSRGQGSSTR